MIAESKYLDIPAGRILTTAQVAVLFSVNKATITRWVKSKTMNTCYISDSGGLFFDSVYISDLIDLAKQNAVVSPDETS